MAFDFSVKHFAGRVTHPNEILACTRLQGSPFVFSPSFRSARRSQSVKLGHVCSLWHARSESLGNRTLISFFSPSFLSLLFFFPRFVLCARLSGLWPSVRHRGNWFFPLRGDELAGKHADTVSQVESAFFPKQQPRLYSGKKRNLSIVRPH